MNFWIAHAIAMVAWLRWLLIGLAAYAVYVVWRLWPILWAMTSSDPITRMKRIGTVASRCYESINRQLVWLGEHASTINELYERRDAELFD